MSSERPELERIFETVSLEEPVEVDEQCKSTLRDAYSTGYVCQLSTNVRTYPISKILHNYFLHFLLGHEDVPKRSRKKCRCKFLERKRGVLWDLCKKRIHEYYYFLRRHCQATFHNPNPNPKETWLFLTILL